MRTFSVVAVSIFALSATAWAGGPVGTGNFRRGEAVKLANKVIPKPDAKNYWSTTTVRGLTTLNGRLTRQAKQPRRARLLVVERSSHPRKEGLKFKSLVKWVVAPVNKAKPVRFARAAELRALGLLTEGDAAKLARSNGGKYGTKGRATLELWGIAGNSYKFNQTAPRGYVVKEFKDYKGNQRYGKVEYVERYVPVTARRSDSRGETAVVYSHILPVDNK